MDEDADLDGPEALARAYVRLGLRLGRVAPGLVDTHLGDPALERAVAAEPTPRAADLEREAHRLRGRLPGSGVAPARRAFLDAQLAALAVVAAVADGRGPGFVAEVEAATGMRIAPGEPDRYRAAHARLADLLPGTGALAARLAAVRERDRVPSTALPAAARAVLAALRARTGAAIGLPDGERVELEAVRDRPWSGFSRRTAPLRSTVSVNLDAEHRAAHLPLLLAHEAYPGHHTECARVEARADRAPERDVFLARTPQSLVAEGAAELGLEVLVGPGWGAWNAAVLGGVGLTPDGPLGEALEAVMGELAEVRQDAALLAHGPDADGAERASAHLRRWLLVDDRRAARMLRFITHPRWRTHTTTYVEGVRLLRPWLAARPAQQTVTDRFAALLDEPPPPALLRSGARAAAAPGVPAASGS